MKDRRRFLAPRDLWDAGTIEAWLEEKAAQGWILEKWGISARFERIAPCRCRVRLDPKDRRNRQQQAEAETLYRDMGWRWNGTLWFYDVYYCFDPTAPDLYTDPETQAWAWGKLLKRALRRSGLSGLLLFLWAALQFDGLWSGHAVQLFLMGMWAIWLFVILYVVREVWEAVRTVWGIRRLKRRLAAGVPMERGDPARAVRRQRIRQIADWTAIALLAGWILVIACGREEMPLSDAPSPLPCVALEALDPEAAGPELDIARYETFNGLLVQSREVTQYSWQPAVSLWAQLDQVVCAPLAEALYRERVDNFLDAWPDAEVRWITDDRFDQAVVVDTGSSQFFAARLGRIVLAERVETDTDLKEHLDDFAAVLAEFQ